MISALVGMTKKQREEFGNQLIVAFWISVIGFILMIMFYKGE